MNKDDVINLIKKQMDEEFNESIRCETLSVQASKLGEDKNALFYYNMTTMYVHSWSVLRKVLKEIKGL